MQCRAANRKPSQSSLCDASSPEGGAGALAPERVLPGIFIQQKRMRYSRGVQCLISRKVLIK